MPLEIASSACSLEAKKILTIKVRCPSLDEILEILLISKPAAWSSESRSSSEISGSTPLITPLQSVAWGLVVLVIWGLLGHKMRVGRILSWGSFS